MLAQSPRRRHVRTGGPSSSQFGKNPTGCFKTLVLIRWDAAITSFDRCLELQPTAPLVCYNLACCHVCLNNREKTQRSVMSPSVQACSPRSWRNHSAYRGSISGDDAIGHFVSAVNNGLKYQDVQEDIDVVPSSSRVVALRSAAVPIAAR